MSKPAARVTAALVGARGRSKLYAWLWDNHAAIAAARAVGGRSDWVMAAAELCRLGFRTKDGKRLKPETVRRTWARVDRDAKAAPPGYGPPAEPPPDLPPEPTPPPVPPVSVTLATEPPRPLIVRPDRPRERQITSLRPSTPKE